MIKLDAKVPEGPIAEKWSIHKRSVKLVNTANKGKLDIILVGTGLAGSAAASSLGELGYNVKAFCFQDSPRRAHSVAAQGASMQPKITRTTATAFTAFLRHS